MSYETADLLDASADLIERDGLHKGAYFPGASAREVKIGESNRLPKCARGAIMQAAGDSWIRTAGPELALTGVIGQFIPEWNDAPERTQQEVLDAFRLAAKQERLAADAAAPSPLATSPESGAR